MKKNLLFSFICAASSAFAQIPNSGFETWTSNSESPHTYSVPTSWISSDVFSSYMNNVFGDPTYVVNCVSQSTSAHAGSYAVDMGVAVSSNGDTVAGAIYSDPSAAHMLNFLMGAGPMFGYPFTSRPANLTGYYKFNRSGDDSAAALLMLTKWNTSTSARDTIVNMEIIIPGAPSTWTAFSIPIYYLLSGNPDTAMVAFGIASQSTPHIGSLMSLDDVAFTGVAGVEEQNELSGITVSPNPFNDKASVSIASSINNGRIVIYDITGNKVKEISGLEGNQFSIDREGLSGGIYMYSIFSGDDRLVSGKLVVE